MRNWLSSPAVLFTSAPFMVAIGISSLILGGLGGSALLNQHLPNPAFIQSIFVSEIPDRPQHTSTTLLKEVALLKHETADLLSENPMMPTKEGYALLNYSELPNSAHLKTKRDPFSPISPPNNKRSLQIKMSEPQTQTPVKVMVPGDESNQIQQVASTLQTKPFKSNSQTQTDKTKIPHFKVALSPTTSNTEKE